MLHQSLPNNFCCPAASSAAPSGLAVLLRPPAAQPSSSIGTHGQTLHLFASTHDVFLLCSEFSFTSLRLSVLSMVDFVSVVATPMDVSTSSFLLVSCVIIILSQTASNRDPTRNARPTCRHGAECPMAPPAQVFLRPSRLRRTFASSCTVGAVGG